jgi:uncharacterized protein
MADQVFVTDEDILFACTNEDEYHLIVLPTEKCNFKCLYCYERHDVGKMSPSIVRSLKALIGRVAPQVSNFSLDWFGGEPLLGLSIIQDVNAVALEACRSGKNGKFRSAITTNGYLLDQATFRSLLSLEVREYQITLDGIGAEHDKTRIQRNGEGSFDRIWSNLQDMSREEGQFRVLLRLHVTESNIASVRSTISHIKDAFGHDPRFRIFLKGIQDLGGYGSNFASRVAVADGDDRIASIERELHGDQPFWHPNSICHASKFNSFIIRADGKISKCTTALYDDVNIIGRLLDDGRMSMDREKTLRWSRGLFTMDRDTLYCPLGGIHEAGCEGCGPRAEAPVEAVRASA